MKKTLDISLTAIFGALITVASFIPVSIIIGGGVFNFTWVMQTISGILLGPYVGVAATFVGSISYSLIMPPRLGPLGILSPVLATLEAGLLIWGYWPLASVLLAGLILIWFFLPVGLAAWPMSIYHIIGLMLILLLRKRISYWVRNSKKSKLQFVGWVITAYCANITRHLLGNILSAIVLGMPANIFLLAIPFTAIEQPFFAIASGFIGIPVLNAIRNSSLDVPILRLNPIASVQDGGV